jgi:arylsulfatase A-like enzyme
MRPYTAATALVVLLSGACGTPGPARDASGRPNILWITAEDMNLQLGACDDPYAVTPNLDRLAEEGVRYTRAFATAPVCSPARSCLVTGLYATTLGTQNLRSRFPVPDAVRGFPSLLREAGYYCTNNVKTDYNTSREPEIIAASWDDCSAKAHWRGRRPGQPFFAVFNSMDTHQSRTFESHDPEVAKRLAPADRHDPGKAPVPPYYPDTPTVRKTIARFYDGITLMDRDHVGRLLRELKEDGLAEDTIVFFFGDNGMGLPRGKRTLYDSGLHVALIARFGGKYRALAPSAPGGTTDRLVSFVDFAPTVLSLAGVPAPLLMQGTSFLGPAAGPPRDAVFGARDRVDEAFDLSRSVRDARWLYIRNFMPHLPAAQPERYSDQAAMRREIVRLAAEGKLGEGPMTYTRPRKPLEELFDTGADPHQVRNLAGSPDHRDILERMRRRLRSWILETRDLGFLTESEMTRRTAGAPPYLMARWPDACPLEKIVDAAELVGRPGSLERQVELLRNSDSAVRFWAVTGLRAAGPEGAREHEALSATLHDASACVRIETAALLAGRPEAHRDAALDLLARELKSEDRDAALRAARALQSLGGHARPVRLAMESALAEMKDLKGDPAMFLRFALEAALEGMDGGR